MKGDFFFLPKKLKYIECPSLFFRKAYVSAVSPAGKDIVVVIDRSGSMARVHGDRSLLQITIEAVTKFLDTLTEKDRVCTDKVPTESYPSPRNRNYFLKKKSEATILCDLLSMS